MKKLLLSIAVALAPVLAISQPALVPGADKLPDLSSTVMRDQMDRVKAVKKLPVHGLTMIETDDGKIFLLSDNGRLAIMGGRWVDLYEGKNISSIADTVSLDKLDLARMGIKVEDFSPFVIGNGQKSVVAFMDPVCDECRALIRQMSSLGSQYTFKVVLLPLHGSASGLAARRIICSPDKKFALDALLTNSLESLPQDTAQCDVTPIQKAMIASSLLGIRTSPFFILPDHTVATVPKGSGRSLTQVLSRG